MHLSGCLQRMITLHNIFLTRITAAQNEVALSYHRVRGLYFLAVFPVATIAVVIGNNLSNSNKENTSYFR